MASITYDIMWREAMMELLDQLESENPEDQALAPKDLSEWACIYIKYIQILRKLEMAYDQIVHPQKRIDMKKAVEACIGRILEIRHWMVKLNKGLDFVNLDDILVDLKLTPDVLEIPVPKYYTEDRSKELDDRDKFLGALLEKYNVSKMTESRGVAAGAPLALEDALRVIQNNERGRQARERARSAVIYKKQRQLQDKRSKMGVALTQEAAATKIQSAMRGFLWRMRIRREANNELMFIGMKPKPRDPKRDPVTLEAKNAMRRKRVQAEHTREYDDAVVQLKQRVREQEGQDMREVIQDKINAWFVENRHPETGEYPDFPEPDDGGSKVILNPPPPTLESLLKEEDDDKKGGGKGGKNAKPAKDAKSGKDKKGKGAADEEPQAVEETVSSLFVPALEAAVQEYVTKWQDRSEAGNFTQKHDVELIKDELRPIVFEEIRSVVDEEMRVLLQNLKDMVDAERAAKTGKKVKKKKKKGKKKKGAKGKKGKKRKDPTAERSMESLFAELVSNGILKSAPRVRVEDYIGSYSLMGATLEKANIIPDPSMGQVRQTVAEYGVLPLGSAFIHEKAPFVKTLLLYGLESTGKTMLTHAIANQAGATYLDLSPRNTDGKYPGKNVAMMIHMAFKVARTMSPSIIHIDECEKVFLSDKKKLKEYGSSEPLNRIKKELLKEMKQVKPGERVLVVGNSREPWLCAKKDEKAFMNFWNKFVFMPLPDYASRRLLWPGLFQRYGGPLDVDFDISTLAHISDRFPSGAIDAVVRSLLTKRRLERLSYDKVGIPEVLQWLCKVPQIQPQQEEQLRKWIDKTPPMVAATGTQKPKTPKQDKGDKGKGGKKGKK